MTSTDNAYTATGNGVREDFLALATDNAHRRPTTGFQTREVSGNNFWFGGSFGGSIQGVYGARVARIRARRFSRGSSPAFTAPRGTLTASMGGQQTRPPSRARRPKATALRAHRTLAAACLEPRISTPAWRAFRPATSAFGAFPACQDRRSPTL